jgi:hypothetical protein
VSGTGIEIYVIGIAIPLLLAAMLASILLAARRSRLRSLQESSGSAERNAQAAGHDGHASRPVRHAKRSGSPMDL